MLVTLTDFFFSGLSYFWEGYISNVTYKGNNPAIIVAFCF